MPFSFFNYAKNEREILRFCLSGATILNLIVQCFVVCFSLVWFGFFAGTSVTQKE